MSSENVELVRELYRRAKAEPDEGFPDELLDPEIEYVNPPDAVEPGVRRGLDAFNAAIGRVTEVYEAELAPEEFIDAGEDIVVVLLTFVIKGRGSGLERHQPQGHVWTVRDGKAVRFRWFNDKAEALEAAGVER
jgi:ketosteroid isomerase-like protein